MQQKDSTATHFMAKEKGSIGYAITLYRFANKNEKITSIDDANSRPQYLGPLGWQFHNAVSDSDILPKLLPIDKLEKITGDNLEKEIWQENNIYAG